MVTQITLGNFNTVNGRNVITGGASGLDTKSIIEGLSKAKRQPAVTLETANKTIDNKTKALNELKSNFTSLRTALDSLRNPPGVDNATDNIFEYRTTSVVGTAGVTASNYVDVTVEAGAVLANYSLDSITQLAVATKQQTGSFALADTTTASAVTAAPTAGLFTAGTVNIRAVDGTVGGIPITLNTGDSLQAVANKFNEVSSRTGIQATILNVAPGDYKLNFTATKTGTTYGFDLASTSPAPGYGVETDPSGVLSQLTFGNVQTAQNAIFSIDGASITRESNAVADVIDGVTITLKDDSPAGAVLINIAPDTELASKAINQFADAYNVFRLFASKQSQLGDDGQPTDDAVLYGDSTFRSIVSAVSDEVTRMVAGITSGPSQFSEIGLKLDNFAGDDENPATKNIFVVDAEALSSALQSDFSGVRKLFEFQQSSDNSNFLISKRSNALDGVTSYSVSIDQTGGLYSATYTDGSGSTTVTLDGTAIPGGLSLKGQAGTVFDGVEFVFASTVDTTVNVALTQGYADRLFNLMETYLDEEEGLLTLQIEELADSKTRNNEEIAKIDEQLVSYRDKLTTQYANLEAALTKSNQILQLLDAQAQARQANN